MDEPFCFQEAIGSEVSSHDSCGSKSLPYKAAVLTNGSAAASFQRAEMATKTANRGERLVMGPQSQSKVWPKLAPPSPSLIVAVECGECALQLQRLQERSKIGVACQWYRPASEGQLQMSLISLFAPSSKVTGQSSVALIIDLAGASEDEAAMMISMMGSIMTDSAVTKVTVLPVCKDHLRFQTTPPPPPPPPHAHTQLCTRFVCDNSAVICICVCTYICLTGEADSLLVHAGSGDA